ncbi:hypothetical protein HLH33_00485 [Gluconacetobacter diazotrophicus]|uniref:Uncharacterized protein n=1 Tax=Gluconacetobacter diazotrophicus TaxID=33996 RepID=A0A7W4FBX3_GLUDI|nr:hypothetical protein [Gluconacetobacter diazotrophicus]MBB2154797.1 hypothetical protein [Gluconacetobacter diazotrophicus]
MPAADFHDSEQHMQDCDDAIEAMYEYDRAVPASHIERAPPAFLIEKYCKPVRVGRNYQTQEAVNLYHPEDVFSAFKGKGANPEAVKAWADHKAAMKAAPVVHAGCTVKWLEWGDSFIGGVRKRPVRCLVGDCTVSVKGQLATITLPDGKTFRKKLDSVGFSFYGGSVIEN